MIFWLRTLSFGWEFYKVPLRRVGMIRFGWCGKLVCAYVWGAKKNGDLFLWFTLIFLRIVQLFDYFPGMAAWIVTIAMQCRFGLRTILATTTVIDFFIVVVLVLIHVSCWWHADILLTSCFFDRWPAFRKGKKKCPGNKISELVKKMCWKLNKKMDKIR